MTVLTKRAALACLALILSVALCACALPTPVPVEDGSPTLASDFVPSVNTTNESSSEFVVDTTDMAGNAIRLRAYPERIVVLDPGDCEILFAIGAGANVVGRSLSCDYPAEVNLLPYSTANGKNWSASSEMRKP